MARYKSSDMRDKQLDAEKPQQPRFHTVGDDDHNAYRYEQHEKHQTQHHSVEDELITSIRKRVVRKEQHTMSREQIFELAETVYNFCLTATDRELYPYQKNFGLRVIQSILFDDGEEITALFSRQSGKTETLGTIVPGLMLLLPTLAKSEPFSNDSRINKFKDGFWVGLFAPSAELSAILASRIRARMQNKTFKDVAADPDINIDVPDSAKIRFANGSRADVNSAGPQSNIEGNTYHLVVIDECQYVSNYKIRKSIHPMLAATNGTIVKIGTPCPTKNEFFEACTRTHRASTSNELRTHFRYDFEEAAKWNPAYAKYVQKEMHRLGYDSDDFRMSYRLQWLLDRGQFIETDVLDNAGILELDVLRAVVNKKQTTFVRSDNLVLSYTNAPSLVASLDIGRSHDSTIITVAQVWWDNPIYIGNQPRYYTHVLNWLEIQGDDHEKQHPQIMEFLSQYKIARLIVDNTGRGDPVFNRLEADLDSITELDTELRRTTRHVDVVPFTFTAQSKHNGYSLLYQEIAARRLTYPAGLSVRKTKRWQRFTQQMLSLEKNWKGKLMQVQAPTAKSRSESTHDDYPDALMLLCWTVNGEGTRVIETGPVPQLASRFNDRQPEYSLRRNLSPLIGGSRAERYGISRRR